MKTHNFHPQPNLKPKANLKKKKKSKQQKKSYPWPPKKEKNIHKPFHPS